MAYKTILDSVNQLLSDMNAMVIPGTTTPMWNYVALWNNQVKRAIDGSGYDFQFPALFLEIQDTSSEVYLNGTSTQDLEIIFHICHQELDSTIGTLDQNLDVFTYRTYVRQYFTNYGNAPTMNSFMFRKEIEDFNHGNVAHWKEIFKCKLVDISGNPYLNGTYKIIPSGEWTITPSVEIDTP